MSTTEQVIEEVVEAVEPVAKGRPGVAFAVVGVVAGAAGAFAGYQFAKRQLETKYETVAKQEIAEAKAFYSTLHKKDEFDTPEKAVQKLIPSATDALRQYQGDISEEGEAAPPQNDPADIVVVNNVFVDAQGEDEVDVEQEERDPEKPYILSKEEFFHNESEYHQSSLTYYEGDGVLADEYDKEIPYPDPIVGENNLDRFGDGSGDPRIVYVRNENITQEFEISKHDGKYAHEVLGLQHSDWPPQTFKRNQRRASRGEDE